MATYYWVGGNGSWGGTDTTHWAQSSGGAGGYGPPTSSDDVVFDTNSGTNAIVSAMYSDVGYGTGNCQCNNLTMTSGSSILVRAAYLAATSIHIYGDVSIHSGATSYAGIGGSTGVLSCVFHSASGQTRTISTTGHRTGDCSFDGPGSFVLGSNWVGGVGFADDREEVTVNSNTILDINGYTMTGCWTTVDGEVKFTNGGILSMSVTNDYRGLFFGASAKYDTAQTGTTILQATSLGFNWTNSAAANQIKFGVLNLKAFTDGYTATSFNLTNTTIAELKPELTASPAGVGYGLDISGATTGTIPKIGKITVLNPYNNDGGYVRFTNKWDILSASRVRPVKSKFTGCTVTNGPIYGGATCVDGGSNSGILFGKPVPSFGALM